MKITTSFLITMLSVVIITAALASVTSYPKHEKECLAKIVHHEAANQSYNGQLAVAQVVMNRVNSPKFPKTICSVASQRGQFFNVHSYSPNKADKRWKTAVIVSDHAPSGKGPHLVGRAMFFRATWVKPTKFFRLRKHVVTIGDHAFYE